MKKFLLFLIGCVLVGPHPAQAAPADTSTGDSGSKLSIELRDGSHVVGKAVDATVRLHSAGMGDLTLSWSGIRSLEFPADTGAARLTATNGDSFAVQFTADTLPVQTGFGKTELPVKQIRSIKATPPSKPNPARSPGVGGSGWRLTLELRDGSRLIGKGLEDVLSFQSATMGDMKLTWAGIRSLEYAGTTTDVARLTVTNNDVYEVQFASTAVRLETSWGKTEVPVKMIRSIQVSATGGLGQLPSGLVALWSGEGNGKDSAAGHDAVVPGGVSFAPAKVGLGFNFDGGPNRVMVPNAPDLNFGAGQDFSIAGWVKLPPPTAPYPYLENGSMCFVGKSDTPNRVQMLGYHFYLSNGRVALHLSDSLAGNGAIWGPAGPDLRDGTFHHLAVTLIRNDRAGGKLYVDGQLVLTFDPTGVAGDLSNDQPLLIGSHSLPDYQCFFYGIIDELAIYNRALSASEMQEIYREQQ